MGTLAEVPLLVPEPNHPGDVLLGLQDWGSVEEPSQSAALETATGRHRTHDNLVCVKTPSFEPLLSQH